MHQLLWKNPTIRHDLLLSSACASRVTAGTDMTSAATDAFAAVVTETFVTSRLACLPSQRLPSLVLISQLLIRKISHLLCPVSPTEVFKLLGDTGTESTDRQQEPREKTAAAPTMMPRCHQTPHRTVRQQPPRTKARSVTRGRFPSAQRNPSSPVDPFAPQPCVAHQTFTGSYGANTKAGAGLCMSSSV